MAGFFGIPKFSKSNLIRKLGVVLFAVVLGAVMLWVFIGPRVMLWLDSK